MRRNWLNSISLSSTFFWFCLAFLFGVALNSITDIQVQFLCLVIVVVLFCAAFYFLSRQIFYIFLLVTLTSFLFGLVRVDYSSSQTDYLKEHVGQELLLAGSILTTPNIKPTYQSFRFDVSKVENQTIPDEQEIFILLSIDESVRVGDKLIIDCKLENFRDDQGYICAFPKLISIESNKQLNILDRMYNGFVSTLTKVYPQPEVGFITGILVGGTTLFSDKLIEQFRVTGTLHLVALSGFNISIIVGFLTIMYERLAVPRKWYAPSIALLLILFVMFVGPAASIVRASIMGFLVVVARQMGRHTTPRNILVATAMLMVMVSPQILLNDLGFQLSFLATVGIIYISPILERKLYFVPKMWQFREALLLAISAEIMVLPLLIWNFEHVSIISPVVNMLIGPLIPAAMLFSFVGGVFGLVNLYLGQTMGLLGWLITSMILNIIEWFSVLPLAYVPFTIPSALLLVYYVAIYYLVKINTPKLFSRPGLSTR